MVKIIPSQRRCRQKNWLCSSEQKPKDFIETSRNARIGWENAGKNGLLQGDGTADKQE